MRKIFCLGIIFLASNLVFLYTHLFVMRANMFLVAMVAALVGAKPQAVPSGIPKAPEDGLSMWLSSLSLLISGLIRVGPFQGKGLGHGGHAHGGPSKDGFPGFPGKGKGEREHGSFPGEPGGMWT